MDIFNPLHYIAANNPMGTMQLLTTKYKVPEMRGASQMMQAVDKTSYHYGNDFAADMLALHPDKDALIEVLGLQQYTPNRVYSNVVEETSKPAASNTDALAKKNHYLLIGLTALALMYFGSQIIKK